MTLRHLLPNAALAAFALFTTPASHAQGLGGMLNKAQAKVNQATSAGASPRRAAPAATPAGPGTDGELPPAPRDYTDVEAQDLYTRTVLANTRPYDDHDNSTTNDEYYRKVNHRHPGFPKMTYDRPALEWYASHNILLMDIINNWSDGFDSMLASYRPQLVYLQPHFNKIKEIHFGVTPNLPATLVDGWGLSWNPATGVFTVLVCSKPGYNQSVRDTRSPSNNTEIEDWILKNVK